MDVSVPYEAGPEAFKKARTEKEQKYTGFKAWMESQSEYGAVSIHALVLVVGSLGSWDPDNTSCLQALHIGQNYSANFVL